MAATFATIFALPSASFFSIKSYTAESSFGGLSFSAIITSKQSFLNCGEPRFDI